MEYPLMLDLAPFTSKPSESRQYRLYAVVVHAGQSMGSGHYYSLARGSNGHWYRFDDEFVAQVSERDALSQEAYLLFYEHLNFRGGTPRVSPTKPPGTASRNNA